MTRTQLLACAFAPAVVAFGGVCISTSSLAQDEGSKAATNRPKLTIEKQEDNFKSARARSLFDTPASVAREFVTDFAKKENVDPTTLHALPPITTLRGSSHLFQQRVNNLDVFGAQIRVLVDGEKKIDDAVISSLVPLEEGKALSSAPKIESRDVIFDKVWTHLKASGELTSDPQINPGYLPVGRDLRLAYEVLVPVSNPAGEWRCYVDANTGEIIDPGPDRITTPGILCENTMPPSHKRAMLPEETRETGDRSAAFEAFVRRQKSRNVARNLESSKSADLPAAGSAKVVDPDPRTAMNDEALTAASNPAAFANAYQEVPLPEIVKRDGVHHLKGPWVVIEDFDPPAIPPATSSDGKWLFGVGDSAFSDAMAYYHIDRSQRYLQSIGFSGPRAIQGKSIRVDANAKKSADNSAYSPREDTLMFGKGCAPDAEDADVILHEYGHALTYSVLRRMGSDWAGGDSKAVGEGFGDYWAATSRVTNTENGGKFRLDRVFQWDGSCDEVWKGRTVNANPDNIRYDPSCTYGAHAGSAKCGRDSKAFTGGLQSDELWSTPTFQAFLTLTRVHKRPRAEVDRVILEAMHRLVERFTMRQFAELIVYEADQLYPGGPHSAVFKGQFQRFGILEVKEEPEVVGKTGDPDKD